MRSDDVATGVEPERLSALALRLVRYPEELVLQPRVAQVISNRAKMAAGEMPLDWGMAESLAYASLLDDGVAVRISGQDSGRGKAGRGRIGPRGRGDRARLPWRSRSRAPRG